MTDELETNCGSKISCCATHPVSHRVILEPITLGNRGQRYRMKYAGETVIGSTRNPDYDACRAILTKGIDGRLEVWRAGATFVISWIDRYRATPIALFPPVATPAADRLDEKPS